VELSDWITIAKLAYTVRLQRRIERDFEDYEVDVGEDAVASRPAQRYETGFDNIPIFGSIARAIVRNNYDEQVTWAQGEVENRIASEASNRLDEEVRKRLYVEHWTDHCHEKVIEDHGFIKAEGLQK
jgi:hypothetical protein